MKAKTHRLLATFWSILAIIQLFMWFLDVSDKSAVFLVIFTVFATRDEIMAEIIHDREDD